MNSNPKTDDLGVAAEPSLRLPSEAATQDLQNAVDELAKMELTDQAKAFALAGLYIEYGQRAKAIEQLKVLVNIKPQEESHLLREVKSEFESLADEGQQSSKLTQVLFSLNPCGECTREGRPGRWIWSPNRGWVCVFC